MEDNLIQSAHLPLACAQAIYLNRKKAGVVETVLHAVANHLVLDFIPHAEPSFLASSYLDRFSPAWFAAAADNFLAWLIVAIVIWGIAESRSFRLIPLLAFAWLPDIIVAYGATHPGTADWFVYAHSLTHAFWKPHFSYPVAWWGWVIGVGTEAIVIGFTARFLLQAYRPYTKAVRNFPAFVDA
jgi:hypothetical protein